MKKLLTLDYGNYAAELPVFEKCTVRAIIMREGRLVMQQSRAGVFKIPGGVVEEGESRLEALMREVLEETGMFVKPETIREIGVIEEKRLDVYAQDGIYHCMTYFYSCDVEERVVPLKLTACEIEKGYQVALETPERIAAVNQALIKEKWKMRDTEFIRLLAEGSIEISLPQSHWL